MVLFLISLAATLASSVMSARSQRTAAKQADYNADHDAKVEEMAAEEAQQKRSSEEREERKQSRMRRASIEAGFAKSGLMMTGTPTYVLEEQAKVDEMNTLEGNRVADTGFMRSMERASIIRQQGKFKSDTLKAGATTTLIQGLGSAATKTASYGKAGGFGDNSLFSGE